MFIPSQRSKNSEQTNDVFTYTLKSTALSVHMTLQANYDWSVSVTPVTSC